ncbi:MAG: hydrolase TatD [Bacteroidetes bacterium CG12_big_fil_rev_8_21_14_0_65_60_17]|nr:MAG: hydrolase TatD [Bacteroidetes bacterium CG12_big_fil_rev_8_21_14_0_65_60_17]
MLIDSHVHINHAKFSDDREAALDRAREAGVKAFLVPGIDMASLHSAFELATRHRDVRVMVGIHPSHVREVDEDAWEEVERLALDPRVVAIGETGLDYYWDTSFNDLQQEFLRRHIRLAARHGLPLVFHNREASEDLVRIVREEKKRHRQPELIHGVFHCFGGPEWLSDAVMELGFHVGIGGTFTFRNAGVPDAIRSIPLERILLETDSPFLAPVPHRGKRNEPAYVRLVAESLALDRGVALDEVIGTTGENTRRLFGL